jgi:hypothetical protein
MTDTSTTIDIDGKPIRLAFPGLGPEVTARASKAELVALAKERGITSASRMTVKELRFWLAFPVVATEKPR